MIDLKQAQEIAAILSKHATTLASIKVLRQLDNPEIKAGVEIKTHLGHSRGGHQLRFELPVTDLAPLLDKIENKISAELNKVGVSIESVVE